MKSQPSDIRKSFCRSSVHNKISNNRVIPKSEFYIMSAVPYAITQNQIESCRQLLSRFCKRYKGEYRTIARCYVPITSKSKNARMGKGKGSIAFLVSPLAAFTPIFLLKKLSLQSAHIVTTKMNYKLPFRLCIGKV